MNQGRRRLASAMGLALCLGVAFVPFGCASGIDYPPLKNAEIVEGPHVPNGTVARLRECVAEFGSELRGSGYEFHYEVKVDEEGRVVDVTTDVPHADLAGCTRVALRAMPVPEEVLPKLGISKPRAMAEGQTGAARGLVGNVVVLGMAIALAEIIIEVGGVTILIAVTVETVQAAGKLEKMCMKLLHECLGNQRHPNPDFGRAKDCGACLRHCMNRGYWPEDKCPR